jgi:hypothetical protein
MQFENSAVIREFYHSTQVASKRDNMSSGKKYPRTGCVQGKDEASLMVVTGQRRIDW